MQVASVVVDDVVAQALRDTRTAALPPAPVQPGRRIVATRVDDRGASHRRNEARVLESREPTFGIDEKPKLRIGCAIELERVAIRAHDDGYAGSERDAIEVLGRDVREGRIRYCWPDLLLGDLAEAQVALRRFGGRGPRPELVGQEQRWREPTQRPFAVGDVEELVDSELTGPECVRHRDPTLVHGAVHSRARRRVAVHALISGADLDLVVRAADPDRRLSGDQLIAGP